MVKKYVEEAGFDLILAAGGSIIGHPMGPKAGGRAMGRGYRRSGNEDTSSRGRKGVKRIESCPGALG